MDRNRIKKWMMCGAIIIGLCLTGRTALNAESAETYISSECMQYCQEIGMAYGICPELLEAIMESESSGNPQAQNGNCKGLMQINETYHKERMQRLGISDIYDARGNILLAADYLTELFKKYEDIGTVLMVYNGSSDALERGERADYTAYAQKIIKRSQELERLHGK